MKQMELNILLNISFLYPLCYILLSFVDIQLNHNCYKTNYGKYKINIYINCNVKRTFLSNPKMRLCYFNQDVDNSDFFLKSVVIAVFQY